MTLFCTGAVTIACTLPGHAELRRAAQHRQHVGCVARVERAGRDRRRELERQHLQSADGVRATASILVRSSMVMVLPERAGALREQCGVAEHCQARRELARCERHADVGPDAGGLAGGYDDGGEGVTHVLAPAAAGGMARRGSRETICEYRRTLGRAAGAPIARALPRASPRGPGERSSRVSPRRSCRASAAPRLPRCASRSAT